MTQSQLIPGTIVAHYKHSSQLDLTNYTYEIMGVAKHSETDELMAVYRPLYASEWSKSVDYVVRPIEMFCGTLEFNGQIVERFRVLKVN